MNDAGIRIRFDGVDPAESGLSAEDLKELIREELPKASLVAASDSEALAPVWHELALDFLQHSATATVAEIIVACVFRVLETRGIPAAILNFAKNQSVRTDEGRPEVKAKVEAALNAAVTRSSQGE